MATRASSGCMTFISIFLLTVLLITVFNLSGGYCPRLFSKLNDYICFNTESKEKGGTGIIPAPPCGCVRQKSGYIHLARSGTRSSETMLMILIIGLIAGPAVSL